MNLSINKSDLTRVEALAQYTIHDMVVSSQHHPTVGWIGSDHKAIVPELIGKYDNSTMLLGRCGIFISAMILFILLYETGLLEYPSDRLPPYSHIIFPVFLAALNIGAITICLKYFFDCRYFIFDGDTVTMMSRRKEPRVYNVDDLKFHLLKVSGLFPTYEISVELPDLTLPERERLVILEEAVTLKTMQGVLAVLFPLMRGDDGPLKCASKRKIEPIERGESTGLYWRFEYLLANLHNWYARYTLNRILFYLVHGKREAFMAREGL